MNSPALETRLVAFLRTVTGHAALNADTELVAGGLADSLTIMDLMVFIESELKVRLEFADVNAEVFRTPATLATVIAGRQGQMRQIKAA